MQNMQNQIQQFQQVFGARQKLGQTLSNAPTLDDGMTAAQKDPLIMTQPSVLNEVRQLQNTMADIALRRQQTSTAGTEQQLKQAQIGETGAHTFEAQASGTRSLAEAGRAQAGLGGDIAQGLLTHLAGAAGDPSQLPLLGAQFLATLPSDQQIRFKPFVDSVVQSVTPPPGLNPAAADAYFRQKYLARMAGSGHSGEVTSALLGTTSTPEVQGVPTQVRTAPALPMAGETAVPTGATPSGSPVSSGSAALAPAPSGPLSGTGRPLFDPATIAQAPSAANASTVRGQANFQEANTKLMDEFQGPELSRYNSANVAIGQLEDVNRAIDTAVRGGWATKPGPAPATRLLFAKVVNQISTDLGGKTKFDPEAVAADEQWLKLSNNLGFNSIAALFGNQKEAEGTLERGIESVPNGSNSPLGAKLVTETLLAANQRQIDERNYKNWFIKQPGHEGDLNGASEAFNGAFPAKDYIDKVLDKYGLTETGFKSPELARDAYAKGYLSKEQLRETLLKQFPDKFK
jgi:hypothetical protein